MEILPAAPLSPEAQARLNAIEDNFSETAEEVDYGSEAGSQENAKTRADSTTDSEHMGSMAAEQGERDSRETPGTTQSDSETDPVETARNTVEAARGFAGLAASEQNTSEVSKRIAAAQEYADKLDRSVVKDPRTVEITPPHDQAELITKARDVLEQTGTPDEVASFDRNLDILRKSNLPKPDDLRPLGMSRLELPNGQGTGNDSEYVSGKAVAEHNVVTAKLLGVTNAKMLRDDLADGNPEGMRMYKGVIDGQPVYLQENTMVNPTGGPDEYIRSLYALDEATAFDMIQALSGKDRAMLQDAGMLPDTVDDRPDRSDLALFVDIHSREAADGPIDFSDMYMVNDVYNGKLDDEYRKAAPGPDSSETPHDDIRDYVESEMFDDGLKDLLDKGSHASGYSQEIPAESDDNLPAIKELDQSDPEMVLFQKDINRLTMTEQHVEQEIQDESMLAEWRARYPEGPEGDAGFAFDTQKYRDDRHYRHELEMERGEQFPTDYEYQQAKVVRALHNSPLQLEDGQSGRVVGTAPDGALFVKVDGESQVRKVDRTNNNGQRQ